MKILLLWVIMDYGHEDPPKIVKKIGETICVLRGALFDFSMADPIFLKILFCADIYFSTTENISKQVRFLSYCTILQYAPTPYGIQFQALLDPDQRLLHNDSTLELYVELSVATKYP